ncbi:MAG: 4'-phosphopantetheinyl transferase superfamily protein [Verrucomicrobia bacterium]|nr:4'-phosphopantetheinyl transferase superfamily protein [Verrucomicrobiota bacterium]
MNLNSDQILIFIIESKFFPILNTLDFAISNEELKRANSFVFDSDRIAYIASHVALRIALSSILKITPQNLQFSKEKGNKPVLKDIDSICFFNLSRTKNHCAIAISKSTEIGIDIESLPSIDNWLSIVKSYFSEQERDHIESLDQDDQEKGFLECWTKREAFLKGTGEGIVDIDDWKQTSFLAEKMTDPRTALTWSFYHHLTATNAFVTLAYKQDHAPKKIDFCDICDYL